MTSPTIHIHDLCKTYLVSERESGALAALQSLVRRGPPAPPAGVGAGFPVCPDPMQSTYLICQTPWADQKTCPYQPYAHSLVISGKFI
jgi:hypothetical protein